MVTASSIAASASSRRPRSARRSRLVVQRHGEVGQERVGPGGGQLPVDGDGFLDRGQRLLPLARGASRVAEVSCHGALLGVPAGYVATIWPVMLASVSASATLGKGIELATAIITSRGARIPATTCGKADRAISSIAWAARWSAEALASRTRACRACRSSSPVRHACASSGEAASSVVTCSSVSRSGRMVPSHATSSSPGGYRSRSHAASNSEPVTPGTRAANRTASACVAAPSRQPTATTCASVPIVSPTGPLSRPSESAGRASNAFHDPAVPSARPADPRAPAWPPAGLAR